MTFARILFLGALLLASGAHAATELVYVGSQQKQLRALRFDTDSGALTPLGVVAEGLRPTWTLAHPVLPVLYAVDDDKTNEGTVTAFAVDRASGALRKLGQVASGGVGATFLSYDTRSATVFAANFGTATTSSIAIAPDGGVAALASTVKATGSGPHRRQASAHAHAAVIDPSGKFVLAPDLGADRVFIYAFDALTRALTPAGAFVAPAGSGPRHLTFGGKYVYVLNELSADVMVLRWDAAHGRLELVQSVQTTGPDFTGVKSAAEIALAPDGRFLYIANRAENTLVVYRVDAASGALTLVQRAPSGGDGPWGFAIDRSGAWLLVANQRSATISVLRIDQASGALHPTGAPVASPAPVNVSFVP